MRWGILVTKHIQIVISLFFGLILSRSIYFYASAKDNNPSNPVDRTSKIEVDEIEYH